ncbi:MAG TPA: DUF4340 domain-containing protein, partial [Gemmatimonadales bacterium]
MTPRQLALIAIAFGALLLLWGVAALVGRGGDGGTAEVFPRVDPASVDTIAITGRADTSILVRRDSTAWRVNGHPADRSAVTALLDALADSTRGVEPVAERPSSHAGLGVDSAAGTRVRLAGRGGVLAEVVAGKRTADLDGGYLRRAADSTVYLVRGALTELLTRRADEWRDRRMGGVLPDSVVGIEVSRGRRSYRLERG